jgi:glutaredoxin
MKTIYTKDSCSYCMMAKDLLNRKGETYIEKLLNRDYDIDTFKSIYPFAKTFPLILEEDGTVIGGFEQLKKLYDKK